MNENIIEVTINNERIAKANLITTGRLVKREIMQAIQRANALHEQKVKYKLGGKTEDALDCSGFTCICYSSLFEGVENQYSQLRNWLFKDEELIFFEQGDVIFFEEKINPNKVSHIGIIVSRIENFAEVIHSSQSRDGVVKDKLNILEKTFRELYSIVAIAKMRPFLFRDFLEKEIKRSLSNVRRVF